MEKFLSSTNFDTELLKVPIEVINEPFVPLEQLNRSAREPLLFNDYLKPEQRFLRKTVAEALFSAGADFAAQGYKLELLSAYRSLKWQKKLFKARVEELRQPGIPEAELLDRANAFTAGIPILAAHTAGAAVDVRLKNEAGQDMDFGTEYRFPGEASRTVNPDVSEEVWLNRQLLMNTMAKYNFANYPFEWWHFSIGDVCWAYLTGHPNAIYAPVEYSPSKQTTTEYSDDLKTFFV